MSISSTKTSPEIPLAEIVSQQLVLVALGNRLISPSFLRANGAQDVLLLENQSSQEFTRHQDHVEKRFLRLADVRMNNCSVAILFGRSTWSILDKRKFSQYRYVLIPCGWQSFASEIALLRYGKRNSLQRVGFTNLFIGKKLQKFHVLRVNISKKDQRRQYGPTGITALALLQMLSQIPYAVLRWSEKIEQETHEGDIDILIDHKAIDDFQYLLRQQIGTYPLDVYSDNGQEGYHYKGVPYFTRNLAKKILDSAQINNHNIRVADPHARFLSFCYHLTFHNKSERVTPGTEFVDSNTYHSPHYYQELERLSKLADVATPKSYSDIERILKESGVMPSLDLIGFYSRKNPFLKKRYFDCERYRVGLATFFIRDFGQGSEITMKIRACLVQSFEILEEGPINSENAENISREIRGGNWYDAAAPNHIALPIYWFVCWDPSPIKLNRKNRKKHPRMDNEKIRIKDQLRRDFAGDLYKTLRLVHSSDNTLEALEHIEHLPLKNREDIVNRVIL
jgi:hypothetical protein